MYSHVSVPTRVSIHSAPIGWPGFAGLGWA
jgi:hypothetical protein